jgi:hypothetical protein
MGAKINLSPAFFKRDISFSEEYKQEAAKDTESEIRVQKWMSQAENGEAARK